MNVSFGDKIRSVVNLAVFGAFLKKTVFHPATIGEYPKTLGDAIATILIHIVVCTAAAVAIGTIPKIKNKLKGKLSIIVPIVVACAPIILVLLNAAIMSLMKWRNVTIAAPSIVLSIFCGWFALYMIGGHQSSSGMALTTA